MRPLICALLLACAAQGARAADDKSTISDKGDALSRSTSAEALTTRPPAGPPGYAKPVSTPMAAAAPAPAPRGAARAAEIDPASVAAFASARTEASPAPEAPPKPPKASQTGNILILLGAAICALGAAIHLFGPKRPR